jgi:hypothetical protein
MTSSLERERDPNWAGREATKIDLALGKVGYSQADITKWWNFAAYDELGGQTPLQAWNREEYEQVKRLAEVLVSEHFASKLSKNRAVLQRLAKAKKH